MRRGEERGGEGRRGEERGGEGRRGEERNQIVRYPQNETQSAHC